jgi:hypothetical protein
MSRPRDIGRLRRVITAPMIAVATVVGASMVMPFPIVDSHAGASIVPVCTAKDLLTNIDFNGPGNPSGAIVLQGQTKQTCELSGQPRVEVFTSSDREIKVPESMFEFTPHLAPPSAPIVISPAQPWAVVEMRWCGFPTKYSRVSVRFPGWAHAVLIEESSIYFEPPTCRRLGARQLAVDDVRRLSAEGIAGRQSHVTVSPSSHLVNGERVRVTVSGYGLGVKFFVSECAEAKDASNTGCGGQLALQRFGLTNMMGTGSIVVTVKNLAASGFPSKGPLVRCLANCVLVASTGGGETGDYAPLLFG